IVLFWPCIVIAQTYQGGLQTMRSPHLIIETQEINLSLDQIKVAYVYHNTAAHEITETLVLASPPTSLVVNQKQTPYQTVQHAINSNGRDVSRELKALGLPFDPIAAIHTVDASPNRASLIAKLRNLHLIDQREETPTWTTQTYYYWQQTFPANSKVSIEQTYKPIIAAQSIKISSFAALLKLPAKMVKKVWNVAVHWTLADETAVTNLQEQVEKYWPKIQQYCPTKGDYQTLLSAYKNQTTKKSAIDVKELKFATNTNQLWANPIQRFNLTIENPKNMHVMLCWNDELKRSANNTLQFAAENYVPLQNLNILYVEK
ncbi:MAG TPA: DUF4424 family protein, partial [Gammaproteobacteria bacterium]|nr:DUF4424 family protein [Gammaproteobacteria bacterium]